MIIDSFIDQRHLVVWIVDAFRRGHLRGGGRVVVVVVVVVVAIVVWVVVVVVDVHLCLLATVLL